MGIFSKASPCAPLTSALLKIQFCPRLSIDSDCCVLMPAACEVRKFVNVDQVEHRERLLRLDARSLRDTMWECVGLSLQTVNGLAVPDFPVHTWYFAMHSSWRHSRGLHSQSTSHPHDFPVPWIKPL